MEVNIEKMSSIPLNENKITKNEKSFNSKKCLIYPISILVICFFIIGIGYTQIKEDLGNRGHYQIQNIESYRKELRICETGLDDKCLTCNDETNECSACNPLFELVDGKCIPNYSFKSVYHTENANEKIDLIYKSFLNYIIEMSIDNEISSIQSYYEFPTPGAHTVYFKLDESKLTSIGSMFSYVKKMTSINFNPKFDGSNLIDMQAMLYECNSLTSVDLTNFNTQNVQSMANMFYNCYSLNKINISNFDTRKVKNMFRMFFGCTSLESIDLSSFETRKLNEMSKMFYGSGITNIDISNFDTENVRSFLDLFNGCRNLTTIKISKIRTYNINNMDYMFKDCSSLIKLDLSSFDTSSLTSMHEMFSGCSKLTSINLSSFKTDKVTKLVNTFKDCSKLITLDISNFDTSRVSMMEGMLSGCENLFYLDISGFDTSKVYTMKNMFYNCSILTSLDISKFNTSKVSTMEGMFHGCSSLKNIDLSKFNTPFLNSISNMFRGCSSLTSINLSSFSVENHLYYREYVFYDCPKLVYIDITPFTPIMTYDKLFNENIGANGVIKINKTILNKIEKYVPNGWKIEVIEG